MGKFIVRKDMYHWHNYKGSRAHGIKIDSPAIRPKPMENSDEIISLINRIVIPFGSKLRGDMETVLKIFSKYLALMSRKPQRLVKSQKEIMVQNSYRVISEMIMQQSSAGNL